MLKVLQINLHHSKVASANLLLLLNEAHYDVVLIQEPWVSKGSVCGLRTPIYTLISHATGRCRACILIRKNLNFFFLNTFSEADLVAIAVGMDGDWIRLGSVYLAYDLDIPSQSLVSLVGSSQTANIPIILGCDANAHHDLWGSSNTNNRGESLLDFIFMNNLSICNVGNKPTFINKTREEVIDVTLCSNFVHDMVTNWSVLNQHSFSDHSYISFSVSLPKSHLRKAKLGPNIRKANWEKFQNILPYITPKIKLKNYSSSRDLDKVASSLQTSLTLALNLSAPPRKPPPRKVKADW